MFQGVFLLLVNYRVTQIYKLHELGMLALIYMCTHHSIYSQTCVSGHLCRDIHMVTYTVKPC